MTSAELDVPEWMCNIEKRMCTLAEYLDAEFGEKNWVYTGSSATAFVAIKLGIDISSMHEPNDIDILYVGKNIHSRTFFGHVRRQDTVERSMTFDHPETGKSIDITRVHGIRNFLIVDGIPINNPGHMLKQYEEEYGMSEKKKADLIKIGILDLVALSLSRHNPYDVIRKDSFASEKDADHTADSAVRKLF